MDTFWLSAAGTAFVSVLFWLLKLIGWGPAVRSWQRIHTGMSRILARLSAMGLRIVGALPHQQNKQLQGVTDSLRAEVESLQKRVRELEKRSRDTRWLELETRRKIYVRICRKLAPDIRVADDYEPKVLVRLPNDVASQLGEVTRAYFSLVPSDGRTNGNKWVADAELSKHIIALLANRNNDDTHLRLGVVTLDGSVKEVALRWEHIQPVGRTSNRRAILTIDAEWRLGGSEMLNDIVSSMTVTDVGAILARNNRLIPANSEIND